MAIFFSSSGPGSTWIPSLKVLLTSTTVLFMVVVMKTSVPVVTYFVASEFPTIYGFILSWLRPPYLYVLINCIIISIAASSKLQPKVEVDRAPAVSPVSPPLEPVNVSDDVPVEHPSLGGLPTWSGNISDERLEKVTVPEDVLGRAQDGAVGSGVKEVNDGEVEVLRPVKLPERNDSTDFSFLNLKVKEQKEKKLPASKRLPSRKSVKSSPEAAKALGVASKPKRHDTLDNTWKAITDGRAMPLTRHLRKSDTWDSQLRRNDENTPPPPSRMKKCETFSDGSSAAVNGVPSLSPSPRSGKLRREPSLGQDELNRRVEAFIKKFNEEMRLQRQESLDQYQEIIQRGAA